MVFPVGEEEGGGGLAGMGAGAEVQFPPQAEFGVHERLAVEVQAGFGGGIYFSDTMMAVKGPGPVVEDVAAKIKHR